MKKLALVLIGTGAQIVSSVVSVLAYQHLHRAIEQTNRLQMQMEEDHARLVRNVIYAEHKFRREPVSGEPVRDLEEVNLDDEEEDH